MLNEKKIRYMTKAAAYETGAEKKNIDICNFRRTDYLGLQMIKSAVAYTVSFALLLFLWAGGRIEEVLLKLTHADYVGAMLKTAAVFYVLGLVLYEIAVYVYFSQKYQKAKISVAKYQKHLKHISEFYERQTAEEPPAEELGKTDEGKNIL